MTAPRVTNTFGVQDQRIDINFSDILNYLSSRNFGLVAWDDVLTKSPWVDVRAYTSINEAISDIGATAKILLITTAQTLTGSLTVPSNVTMVFAGAGSIVEFGTSVLTLNGPIFAADRQIFSGFAAGNVLNLQVAMPDWFGTGSSAWIGAIQALQIGGTLKLGGKTYTINTAVPLTCNRMTIEGLSPELTQINCTPASDGLSFFTSDGTHDNMTFRNFTMNHTNRATYHNTQGFNIAAGDTKHTWERVFFTAFGRYGIHLGSGTYYMLMKSCRFIRINDSASTSTPIALYSEGTNVLDVHDCYFSENDKDIQVTAGTSVQVFNNNFEVGGDSLNTNIEYFAHFGTVNNLWFANNYIEANDTNGGAFLYLNGCKSPVIEFNYFNGQEGSTDKTDTWIKVRNAAARNVVIRNNNFVETITYFIDTDQPVKVYDNYFVDAGVELTTYAAITALMTDKLLMAFDFMGNYAASSTITGWTTPTAKIWFEKVDDIVYVSFEITGTSNATTVSFTLPFINGGNFAVNAWGIGHDNAVDLTAPIYITMATGSATVNVFKGYSAVAWTNVNAKKVYGQFFYQAA